MRRHTQPWYRLAHPVESPPDRDECSECGSARDANFDCDRCKNAREADEADAGDPDATPRRRRR